MIVYPCPVRLASWFLLEPLWRETLQPTESHAMAGTLTLRQEAFATSVTTPNTPAFCKPTAAYRTISPQAVPGAQRVGAHRMITNDNVRERITGQLNIGQLGGKLKKCLRIVEQALKTGEDKFNAVRELRGIVMDYSKLTGQLVEKREIRHTVEEQKDIMRRVLIERRSATRPAITLQEAADDSAS